MSSSSPYHCVTPLVTSISEKSIRTCGQEQSAKQYSLMLCCWGWASWSQLLLPCRCPSSRGCKTSCYFSRTRPTSWFGLPGVKHQIQTCKRKTLSNPLDISDRYSPFKCRWSTSILLLVEDGVDRPLLHMRLFAMSPGLIWEQIKAGVRVRAVLAAGEQVPAGNRGTIKTCAHPFRSHTEKRCARNLQASTTTMSLFLSVA